MRTPKIRAVAVVAGFAGVSMLVAGTASAMARGQTETPIVSAIQLQQEDPQSQTAPVPAAVSTSAPIEVGSGAIECDSDGTCASTIKIQTKEIEEPDDPAPITAPNPRRTPSDSAEEAPRAKTEPTPKGSGNDAAPPADKHRPDRDKEARPTPGDKGDRRDTDRWDITDWSPGDWANSWNPYWRDGWREGWANDWKPGNWHEDAWQGSWGKTRP